MPDKKITVPVFPYDWALNKAEDLKKSLQEHCVAGRCQILGSIRRKEEYVKDIDLLCVPKTTTVEQRNLFGEERLRDSMFIKLVKSMGVLKGDPESGKVFSVSLCEGLKAEIYTATQKNWGVQKVIRTGPWRYSRALMTRLRERGFKVANGGYLYRHRIADQWDRIPVETEKEFFHAIREIFVEPEKRV